MNAGCDGGRWFDASTCGMPFSRVLLKRDGRRYRGDVICIRFGKLVQKLSRRGRKGFDVAPLPFGVKRIESQTGFTGATDSADDSQLVERDVQVNVFQVVNPNAAQLNC